MGNATSCAPSIASISGVAKVVSSDGTTELYARPVKAAELMLENPGKFVCDAAALSVGHRIHGLSADDELARRRLYLLLPIELLYSVLTPEEMASFTSRSRTSSSNNKLAINGGAKNIFPSLGEFCMFLPKSSMIDDEESRMARPAERFYAKQRSWRPALETIVEAPSSSSCRYSY